MNKPKHQKFNPLQKITKLYPKLKKEKINMIPIVKVPIIITLEKFSYFGKVFYRENGFIKNSSADLVGFFVKSHINQDDYVYYFFDEVENLLKIMPQL